MNRTILIIIGVFGLLLASCTGIKVPGKEITCPPPPSQECMPVKWNGLAMDTSESYRKVASEYYLFGPVNSLNTSENEWGLSFIDNMRAVLTFDDRDMQSVMITRFTTDTKATFESGIGSPFESSNGAMSIRGDDIVIAASSNPEDPSVFIGNSNLYTAKLDGNMIREQKYLGSSVHKSDFSWESHPTMSANKDVIFFASDRNSGNGVDLFFTFKLKDGSWSEPINLGDSINTQCEEITPFLTENGKNLYFSSCGHETVGGYDIFMSDISVEFWGAVATKDMDKLKNSAKYFSKAKNLRPPLNTTADELFPSSPEDPKNILYYASNQASEGNSSILFLKGGFDIYKRRLVSGRAKLIVEKNLDINIDLNTPDSKTVLSQDIIFSPTYTLRGTVYNAQTNEPVPNATVIIRQTDGDPESLKREEYLDKDREVDLTTQGGDKYFDSFKIQADKEGKYVVELEKDKTYEVMAQKEDMFFDSFKTRLEKEDPRNDITKDLFVPPALTLRINFPSDVYQNPYKYALDTNGVETNQTWSESISLLAQNLIISKDVVDKLILIGHTDDQGNEEYNQKLGLNRVNFIIDQLVKRGVPREMLEGQSAGETDLLEEWADESKKMWRKRCRRVELQKIMKSK